MMPRRTAIVTASVRSLAPSFSMMCLTCTLTVSSEMDSRSAMSRLRLPPATCCSTSSSRSVSGSSRDVLGQLRRDLLRDPLPAGVDLTHRIGQLLRRHALQHVAARAGGQRALNLDVPFERRQHDDARVGELVADRDHRVDAADVRQAEIHQRDVRTMLAEALDRLAAGRRLGDQHHVRLAVDDGGDAFAQQRMIVDAEDADLWLCSLMDVLLRSSQPRRGLRSNATRPGTSSSTSVPAAGAAPDLQRAADPLRRARACPACPQWPSLPGA